MRNLFATIGGAVLWAAPVLAQADASAMLQRAVLIERQEGDLRQAERAYRGLLDGGDGAVATAAALHLGELLWRLDRVDEARPLLERVRAAGGELGAEAAAVLQGQDPDGKQAQALAAKVKQVLDLRLAATQLPQNGDELAWLGAAVVPECARRLQALHADAVLQARKWTEERLVLGATQESLFRMRMLNPRAGEGPAPSVRILSQCLFEVGGPAALALVREQLRDAEPEWRRLIAAGSEMYRPDGTFAVHESMLPVVAEMLRDPDPLGVVPAFAMRAAKGLPFAEFVPYLRADNAVAREAAWRQLLQHPIWGPLSGDLSPTAAAAVQQVLPTVEWALAGGDPVSAPAAFDFLLTIGMASERGSGLLLQWLPKVPVVGKVQRPLRAPIASLVACAQELGPADAADGRDDRRRLLAMAAAAAADATASLLLDLAELGYDSLIGQVFPELALRHRPTTGDLVRICRWLGKSDGEWMVVAALDGGELDLPPEVEPLLAARFQGLLAALPEHSENQPWGDREKTINSLARLLGRTGNPAALAAFAAVQQRADLRSTGVYGAMELASRCKDPAVGRFLTGRMIDERLSPSLRNDVFRALVGLGEPSAIGAFADAYRLGLEPQRVPEVGRPTGPGPSGPNRRGRNQATRGLAYLRTEGNRYSLEQRLAIWQSLLASEAWADALADAATGEPQEVQVAILEALPKRVAAAIATDPQWKPPQWVTNMVEAFARSVPADDAPASVRHRAAFAAVCDCDPLAESAIRGLRDRTVVRALADHLRARMHSRESFWAFRALHSHGELDVSVADTVAGLQNAVTVSEDLLDEYLAMLPRDAAPEIVRAVEALLDNDGVGTRIAACRTLGRLLSASSAPGLLAALRDSSGDVRTAATEALQQIRLYHEQRAYWDQFETGIQTGRDAAAAKLLAQAKPDQPKDQRLLALGSLGALGAAEALPYLIDWSKDADAAVAAAALAAIEQIQRAATARPGGK